MAKRKQELTAQSKQAVIGKSDTAESRTPFVKDATELNAFLLSLRDRMSDETVAPIFALSAMNQVLTQPNMPKLMKAEAKELARDVWLRLKQAGLQVNSPAMLFEADEGL